MVCEAYSAYNLIMIRKMRFAVFAAVDFLRSEVDVVHETHVVLSLLCFLFFFLRSSQLPDSPRCPVPLPRLLLFRRVCTGGAKAQQYGNQLLRTR